MKKIPIRILCAVISALLSLACVGCSSSNVSDNTDDTTASPETKTETVYQIEYKRIDFVPAESIKALRDSLFKLLSNTRIPYGEKGEYIGEKVKDPSSPSVPKGYSYGLLDLDFNGVPELVIDLGGGSAGNAFYEAYDVHTGQLVGSFGGGHSDEWCVYFCTETGEFRLYGQFWHRIGWSGRTRYIVTMEYDEESGEYNDRLYLRSYHEIAMANADSDAEAENGTYVTEWVEKYPDTYYSVYGEYALLDDFYNELDSFNIKSVRITETGLKLFSVWNYEGLEGDELYAAIADDLANTPQKFVDIGEK